MVDPQTATPDEIANQAKAILKLFSGKDRWSENSLRELVEWLGAYVLRLANDLHGNSCGTTQDVSREICEWAKGVERFFHSDR